MIDLGLTGKRAVVSGAGRIPGRAGHGTKVAVTLAEAGASVVCIDVDEGRARSTVELIERVGGTGYALAADMLDSSDVDRALDDAASLLGGLDVCVDIIGNTRWDQTEDVTDDVWNRTLLFNLTQAFYLFRATSRHLIAQGTGGSIVALCSVDGVSASPFHAAYGAAKAGLIHLIKTCADEWGRHGIRVNGVAPGATPFTRMPCRPHSSAHVLMRWIRPAFAAPYAAWNGDAETPSTDASATSDPPVP